MSATTYFTNSDIEFITDGSEFAIESVQLTGEGLKSFVSVDRVLCWINDQLTNGSLEEYIEELVELKELLTSSNQTEVEVEIDYWLALKLLTSKVPHLWIHYNKQMNINTLLQNLPIELEAKADLIDFIEGHAADANLSTEEYVSGGLLVDEAQMVLNDYAEGFCFTMEDVMILAG